ncbi:hypothetical protein LINPERHAP1_LOCUS32951, partial [Linum perenne]
PNLPKEKQQEGKRHNHSLSLNLYKQLAISSFTLSLTTLTLSAHSEMHSTSLPPNFTNDRRPCNICNSACPSTITLLNNST